jgi:predicted nucleotidyltransferase
MRLPPQYADFFKAEVAALRPQAAVYLFGSRRDQARKGGDVDILVLSQPKLNWEETARLRRRFWE